MFDEDTYEGEAISISQRILYATVLPLLLAYVGSRLWVFWIWSPRTLSNMSKNVGPHIGMLFAGLTSIGPLLVLTPFVLLLVGGASTVRWTRRGSAFLGGMFRLAIAMGCGGAVLFLLHIFS